MWFFSRLRGIGAVYLHAHAAPMVREYNLMIVRSPATALCAALLLAVIPVGAEQPIVRLFTTEDGLVRNWVNRIRRDSRGRLWFCTLEGLSLFDGRRFANYGTSDGLPHRAVTDILEAGDGSYWLTTGAGLFQFRPRAADARTSFVPVPLTGGPATYELSVLFQSRAGQLWFGTAKGLYRIHGGPKPEAVAVALPGSYPDLPFPAIYSLAETQDGALWIGTEHGLVRRRADGTITFWDWAAGTPTPVRSVMVDRDGVLWAGGVYGFCTLDITHDPPSITTHRFTLPHPLSDIHAIYQDGHGTVWIGGFGLARVLPTVRNLSANADQGRLPRPRFQFFDRTSVLGSQYAFTLTEDSAGNLWVGTGTLGAARILKPGFSQFTEHDGLESKIVQSVFSGQDGTLYAVSGARHALNEFDGERFTSIFPRVPPSVNSLGYGEDRILLRDRRGEWWMATGAGLLRYPKVARAADLSRATPKALYKRADGLPDEEILRLFEDSRGDIWIGTGFGLARWRMRTEAIEDFSPALQKTLGRQPTPLAFAEDSGGQIWVGLYQGGLVRIRGGLIDSIGNGQPPGSITNLLIDHQGRLWVATTQAGLIRIDDPAAASPVYRNYSAKGMRSQHVFALAEDPQGRIYVAGGQGVDRLDPATDSTYQFAASGGLPLGEVQRLHSDRHGAIWFASNFGLSRYIPEPDDRSPPPAPAIHEVRVSGVPVLVSDEGESQVSALRLPAGRNSIEISFGSVDFSIANNVRYRCRLSPGEAVWKPPAVARSVQYAGIGSGEYRFEVQAVGPGGAISSATAAVEFRIAAPFWRTWWFFGLAGAFLAALIAAAHLSRVRHLLVLERVRAHLAADLHDDLGSGLAEIAILTEVARQGKTQNLEIVAQRARELRSTMGDIVWSVDPEYDNLDGLICRWRQCAFMLLGNEGLEFHAPGTAEARRIALSPDRRRHLLLLFKEIVTNVARHARAKHVLIEVRLTHALLELEVRDDGCGFEPERCQTGNGLKNIALRAEALRATLLIQSAAGRGSVVRLTVPV